jgi:cytosine/adenosine deaminase-related metal-dependent hydrolase
MPDRLELTAYDALEIATMGGARCCGLEHRIGSLTPGKEADVVLLRRDAINMLAARDPVAAVVFHAGVRNVDTVIVGGEILKHKGRLAYGDLARKAAELQRSADRFHTLLGDRLGG